MQRTEEPIPPFGFSVADETLHRMLKEVVLGSSPLTLVTSTAESHYLLHESDLSQLPLLLQRPSLRHLYMAVGCSTTTGRIRSSDRETNCDHFVALHVDISRRTMELMDSYPTTAVRNYIMGRAHTLAQSIFGFSDANLMVLQPFCRRQEEGSSDCAVHTWTNIAVSISEHQYVHAFRGINVVGDEVTRDVFRCIYETFFSK